MTTLQKIVAEHFRVLDKERRERRLAEYEAITAALAAIRDDEDAGAEGYDGWLGPRDRWRGCDDARGG